MTGEAQLGARAERRYGQSLRPSDYREAACQLKQQIEDAMNGRQSSDFSTSMTLTREQAVQQAYALLWWLESKGESSW
jgi:hypothetical protein